MVLYVLQGVLVFLIVLEEVLDVPLELMVSMSYMEGVYRAIV